MKEYKPTNLEKKRYLLPEKRDLEILGKCRKLEKNKLSKQEKYFVKFIKTQLLKDWRKPLLKELNKLLRKYK